MELGDIAFQAFIILYHDRVSVVRQWGWVGMGENKFHCCSHELELPRLFTPEARVKCYACVNSC